ncbi:RHS repeat-associated core domain-containing protein [Flavobacterium branchiophilum]|uniref:RHS repeat domain-containing protein n=1 Tax=Flavobacterium branchiophilum TaxID=55197 RepID=UPI0002EDCA10|nr:RHS repeat-associated core domain-containing protein [Flavobacterium branchiophilum]
MNFLITLFSFFISFVATATGTTNFDYNKEGYLTQAKYADGSTTNRYPDAKGNLYEDANLKDREYTHGGKLVKKGSWHYKYNHQGFLTTKYKKVGRIFVIKEDEWNYEWNSAGLLEKVYRPDGAVVSFGYDALGRRIWKNYRQTTTHRHWDGNVPLHSLSRFFFGKWKGFVSKDALSENLITWIFEEDSFSPIAKLRGEKKYSILADHLGTPYESYDDKGDLIWSRELNSNGKVIKETGIQNFCPFLYQGQSLDNEIELAYNRFRYYDVEDGRYISQDPIGLAGNNPNFYSYTKNSNYLVDLFRLDPLGTGAPLKNGFLFYKNELSLWTIYHKNVDTIMAHVHLGILAYWLVNTIRYQLKQQKSHHNFMVKIMMMK